MPLSSCRWRIAVGACACALLLGFALPLTACASSASTAEVRLTATSDVTVGSSPIAANATSTAMSAATHTPDTSGPGEDPCALLTPAMLQQALGHSFGAPASIAEPKGNALQAIECRYVGSGGARALFVYVLYASAGAASADYTSSKQALNGSSVSGIGDAAFYESQGGSINVLKGRVFFTLALTVAGTPQRAAAEQLATQVAAKL